MADAKLSRLELQIMEKLWEKGPSSIREIQDGFPENDRPGYTTIQMTMYRMEVKKILRRTKKVGNFHIFEALLSRETAQQRLVDDLVALFGGRTHLVMSHLVKTGKLRLEDVKEAEKQLKKLSQKDEC